MSSDQGVRMAVGQLASHTIGRNPKMWGIIFIATALVLLIFIILTIMYYNKYRDCESSKAHGMHEGMRGTYPSGNLYTGNNNPLWHYQMGDAGWGGTLHTTHQKGQSRVWGVSADGDHQEAVVPRGHYSSSAAGSAALGEAHVLSAAQADPSGTAKHMNDDDLLHVMNGGDHHSRENYPDWMTHHP